MAFALYADGLPYYNPAYLPTASGVNAFTAASIAIDSGGNVTLTYALDASYAGATVTATIQLGGDSTTTAMSAGSGTTFTAYLSDYYAGTTTHRRGVRCVLSASVPGASGQQRVATSSYPIAGASSPL